MVFFFILKKMCSTNERPVLGQILASHWLVRKSDQKLTDDLCGWVGVPAGCLRYAEGMWGVGRGCVNVRRAGISNIIPVFAMVFT